MTSIKLSPESITGRVGRAFCFTRLDGPGFTVQQRRVRPFVVSPMIDISACYKKGFVSLLYYM